MRLQIIPHPDDEVYERVTKAVQENDGYCPCLLEKNEDTKCLCTSFKYQSKVGKCHCGRYVKVPSYYTDAELEDALKK